MWRTWTRNSVQWLCATLRSTQCSTNGPHTVGIQPTAACARSAQSRLYRVTRGKEGAVPLKAHKGPPPGLAFKRANEAVRARKRRSSSIEVLRAPRILWFDFYADAREEHEVIECHVNIYYDFRLRNWCLTFLRGGRSHLDFIIDNAHCRDCLMRDSTTARWANVWFSNLCYKWTIDLSFY